MTRINVVPVEELSDQHLIAEYHELPRVIKQNINISDAPDKYVLGKGHVKWAKRHSFYVLSRYVLIVNEMAFRGFRMNYRAFDEDDSAEPQYVQVGAEDYNVTQDDIELNRQRIRGKIAAKPDFYRWTKRTQPNWTKKGD